VVGKSLLGYNTMQSVENKATTQRNMPEDRSLDLAKNKFGTAIY
jgi:hypothetical protein